MRLSALKHEVKIVWGGVWDMKINDIEGDLEDAVADYVKRRKKRGQRAFTDGPHFELSRKDYP
jgi:peptidoglycan L-alanyl-D-glutamate endopeptidase CwlK